MLLVYFISIYGNNTCRWFTITCFLYSILNYSSTFTKFVIFHIHNKNFSFCGIERLWILYSRNCASISIGKCFSKICKFNQIRYWLRSGPGWIRADFFFLARVTLYERNQFRSCYGFSWFKNKMFLLIDIEKQLWVVVYYQFVKNQTLSVSKQFSSEQYVRGNW